MKKVVHKYIVPYRQGIMRLPKDIQVLSVQMQDSLHGQLIVLWGLRDLNAPLMERVCTVVFTGEPFDLEGKRYVGTTQARDGLVYHVFLGEEQHGEEA